VRRDPLVCGAIRSLSDHRPRRRSIITWFG
jgi:hypothetical protein